MPAKSAIDLEPMALMLGMSFVIMVVERYKSYSEIILNKFSKSE